MHVEDFMKTRSLLVLLMAGVFLMTVSACRDDDHDGVWPTMSNIWPHADGTSWTYEMDYAEYDLEMVEKGE